jgi:hypothetical protein
MYTYEFIYSRYGEQERRRLLTKIRERFPSAEVSPWSSPRLRLYTEWTAYVLAIPVYFLCLFKETRGYGEEPRNPAEQYIVLQDDALRLFEGKCNAQPNVHKFFPDNRWEFVAVNRWVLRQLRELEEHQGSDEPLKKVLGESWDKFEEILEFWEEGAPR